MQNVLKYELGPIPWSIAAPDGTVAKTVKSKIVEVLEKDAQPMEQDQEFFVWVFDAMAVIYADCMHSKNIFRTFNASTKYVTELWAQFHKN